MFSYLDIRYFDDKLDKILVNQAKIDETLAKLLAREDEVVELRTENAKFKSDIAAAVDRTNAIETDGRAGLPSA